LHVQGNDADTTWANHPADVTMSLQNSDATNNNWFNIVYRASDDTAAAGITTQFYDQASHYASINFETRGAGGYSRALTIKDGKLGIADSDPSYELSVTGDTYLTGSATTTGSHYVGGDITGSVYYGEMYAYNNATSTIIPAAGVYVKVGGDGTEQEMTVTSGLLNNITHANGTTTISHPGIYKVVANVSGTGGNNKEYHYAIGVDGVRQVKCHTPRKLSAADIGSWGVSCLLDLADGEAVTLLVENETDATDVTISDFNLSLEYIGE
jgi:hypothetical protein